MIGDGPPCQRPRQGLDGGRDRREEKDAQADYETLMTDSADKRTADSKSLQEKGSTKAELEGSPEDHKGDRMDAAKELMATLKYIQSLQLECDWLYNIWTCGRKQGLER